MVNANVVISVSAVLVALIITIAVLFGVTDENGGTTVKIAGVLNTQSGDALDSEMYYCAGDHCNYYGADAREDFPGYLALAGYKEGGNTFLSEFSLGYTFGYDSNNKLLLCRKLAADENLEFAEIAATFGAEDVGTGATFAVGDDSFTVSTVEKGSANIMDASVFGLKIPTPQECAMTSASSFDVEARRRMDVSTEETPTGYAMWMLAFYTYKTHSGIPEFGRDTAGLSPDVFEGWSVAEGLSVSYTESWKDLPFWTTMMGQGLKPKQTAWDEAETKTVSKTITTGKCENENSMAKIWVNGDDIALGFAGTDVFLLSRDSGDLNDIFDDMNGWPVTKPANAFQSYEYTYHAGFAEYVDRVDDCIVAVLDELVNNQNKKLKYVTGHSLGGASANIWQTFHPEYTPESGTYTYGAPITVYKPEPDRTCEVNGHRYFNEDDPVASHGLSYVLDFDGFEHNMDKAYSLSKKCRLFSSSCSYKSTVAGDCKEYTGHKCSRYGPIFGTACFTLGLATSHLQYADWMSAY